MHSNMSCSLMFRELRDLHRATQPGVEKQGFEFRSLEREILLWEGKLKNMEALQLGRHWPLGALPGGHLCLEGGILTYSFSCIKNSMSSKPSTTPMAQLSHPKPKPATGFQVTSCTTSGHWPDVVTVSTRTRRTGNPMAGAKWLKTTACRGYGRGVTLQACPGPLLLVGLHLCPLDSGPYNIENVLSGAREEDPEVLGQQPGAAHASCIAP